MFYDILMFKKGKFFKPQNKKEKNYEKLEKINFRIVFLPHHFILCQCSLRQ